MPPCPCTRHRRVAITGVGIVAALGNDVATVWAALAAGATGIVPAGELPDAPPVPLARATGFDADEHFPPRERPRLDRVSQFARVAARQAMQQAFPGAARAWAAEADLDPARCGTVFGAGLGHEAFDDGYRAFYGEGRERLHPFLLPRGMPGAAVGQLAATWGLQGAALSTSSACASATHAIGLGYQMVRSGMLDLALVGGAEASLLPGVLRAWQGLRVLSGDTCRPFSRDRSGLVLGEGAAVLVLEDWQQALRRGAVPLAEVVGFGMGADGADAGGLSVDGAERAMRSALADAGLAPADVDYVNAHGTGLRGHDRAEALALARVFGRRLPGLPVSSSKGQFGHALHAAGALEAVATVQALRHGLLPPTVGWREADPECPPGGPLDTVPHLGREQPLEVALSNSFAFGGLNAVLALRRAAPSTY